MAAQNHEWTLSEVGSSEGLSGGDRHKPDGQVDFAASVEARQAVPTNGPENKFDLGGLAPGRVDVPDPDLESCIPEPFAGDSGTTLDFNAVAPDTDRGVSYDLEGDGAPAASSFPTGSVPS